MHPTPPEQPTTPVKIYYLRIPTLMRSAWELVVLAVGILISYVVAAAIILALLSMIVPPTQSPQRDWLLAIILLLAFTGPAAWVWLFLRRPYRIADRHRPFRQERLVASLAAPDAASRFPHRLIENAFRHRVLNARRLLPLLQRIPAGRMVFANLPQAPRPAPNAVSFEPVDIIHDADQLGWLLRMNLEQQGLPAPLPEPAADEDPRPTVRKALSAFRAFLRRWESPVRWAALVIWLWKVGWIMKTITLAFVALIVFIRWILPLFRERSWWLVPGGLICREFRFWRKDLTVKIFTPASTPLLIEANTGEGFLLDQGRVIKFPCRQAVSWVIASGWISTARTPTLDEVRAFLGQP